MMMTMMMMIKKKYMTEGTASQNFKNRLHSSIKTGGYKNSRGNQFMGNSTVTLKTITR